MSDVMQQRIKSAIADLDTALARFEALNRMEQSTGVKKSYAAIGAGLFLTMFVFFGIGARFLTNLVGFVYPAYASFKAIKSVCKEDDTQWLTYWVVFAFFTLIETFTDVLLYWVPMYYPIKLAFLVWCLLPQTQGAVVLYHHLVEPLLSSYEPEIDQTARTMARQSGKFVEQALSTHSRPVVNAVADGLSQTATHAMAAAQGNGTEKHKDM